MSESNVLNIDFGADGLFQKRSTFYVSCKSVRIRNWWNDKYNNLPEVKYDVAIKTMEQASNYQEYDRAALLFQNLGDYRNSQEKKFQCREAALNVKYNTALDAYSLGKYSEAISIWEELGDYRDTINRIEEAKEHQYQAAKKAMNTHQNEEGFKQIAYDFQSLGDYLDSVRLAEECFSRAANERKEALYLKAIKLFNSSDVSEIEEAKDIFQKIKIWKDSSSKLQECDDKIKHLEKKRRLNRALTRIVIIIVIIIIIKIVI